MVKALQEKPGVLDANLQLELLAEISEDFARSLDIDTTLEQALRRVVSYLDAEAASVFLFDPKSRQLECRACVGPVDVVGLRLDMGAGLVGKAASQNACQIIRNVDEHPEFEQVVDSSTGFKTRSAICTPMRAGDRLVGVLQVLNKQHGGQFTAADQNILKALAAPTSLAIHNAQMADDLVRQQRIKKELSLARRVQRSLLPKRRTAPFPVLGVNLPAREVSGDFYDHFELPDGRIGFTLGDVSGKGVDAAFLMVRATTLLRSAGKRGLPPGQWLARVNDELNETISGGMFVCAAAGYYDPARRLLIWANAGLPPVLIEDDEEVVPLGATAPPLAILPAQKAYEEHKIQLSGESVYFYTDGVIESRDKEGKELGVDGLVSLLQATADQPPRPRVGQLVSALRDRNLQDDTTILMIEDSVDDVEMLSQIRITADAINLKPVRDGLKKGLSQAHCTQKLMEKLLLVVNEAIANIIRHAYRGDPDGEIEFTLYRRKSKLIFYLRDWAPRVDVRRIAPRNLDECRPGGLGVNIIDCVMDSWIFTVPEDDNGNLLIMTCELDKEGKPCQAS